MKSGRGLFTSGKLGQGRKVYRVKDFRAPALKLKSKIKVAKHSLSAASEKVINEHIRLDIEGIRSSSF